jgi:hypothetical protein
VSAARRRASTFWVGDTWKVLECLLDHRPDLTIRVVPAPPSGIVVVRGLDPDARPLNPGLLAEYEARDYPHAPGVWPARYGIVANDEAGLRSALGLTGGIGA